jgi:hypothetical protein
MTIKGGEIRFAVIFGPCLALVCGLVLLALRQTLGAEMALLGGLLAASSLAVASWAVRRTVREGRTKFSVISKLQLVMLIKLPIIAAVVYWVCGLGLHAAGCFTLGLVMVYLCLFVGAILSSFAPSTHE